MNKVYVFGPIYLFGESYIPVYKSLVSLCQKYFKIVIGTYPDFWDSKETPQAFYKRTVETIRDCDLFVAEVSSPSHGVGMELQMAVEYNIPVIALVKQGIDFQKSTMVLGMPGLRKVLRYIDQASLLIELEKEIATFAKKG